MESEPIEWKTSAKGKDAVFANSGQGFERKELETEKSLGEQSETHTEDPEQS